MTTDTSNFCVESPPLAELPTDDAMDAQNSMGVWRPMPLGDAESHRPLSTDDPSRLISLAKILWVGPWSLWGLVIGGAGLLAGVGVRRRGRVLEFWGGPLPLFLKYFPFVAGSPVATFGHVILGRSERYLDACRPHQMVHVKQYERWGPLFVPAYLTCWCVLWCCGKRPYHDNPFEREAYGQTDQLWGDFHC